MLIKSLERCYEVVCVLEKEPERERYLCREQPAGDGCSLVRIIKKEWIAASLSFLTEEKKKKEFIEYKDCFVSEGMLCLVFTLWDGIPLGSKMQQEFPLTDRLAVFDEMLTRLILLNMAPYIAWDCLAADTVYVAPTLGITFAHPLKEIAVCAEADFSLVVARVKELYSYLFQEELRLQAMPPLRQWEEGLEKNRCESYLALYEGFPAIRRAAEQMAGKEPLEPGTYPFLLWKKAKSLFRPLEKLFILILLLLSLACLFYNVKELRDPGEGQAVFKKIGTVEIREE